MRQAKRSGLATLAVLVVAVAVVVLSPDRAFARAWPDERGSASLGAASPASALLDATSPASALVDAASPDPASLDAASRGVGGSGSSVGPGLVALTPRSPAGGRWVLPVPGARVPADVVHPFAPPKQRWEPGHRGVDLAAAVGSVVVAPAAGTVSFAGSVAGRPVLVVQHPDGRRSTFEPVAATVAVGTSVRAGDAIGTVVSIEQGGHCAPASCVHWGLLRGETYLDPLATLRPTRVVLLPRPTS